MTDQCARLLLLLLFLVGPGSAERCRQFLDTYPGAVPAHFTNLDGQEGDWVQFQTQDGRYRLSNLARLHQTGETYHGENHTSLCVGFVQTTTHTYLEDWRRPLVYVTLHTRTSVLTGVVNVSTACWRGYGSLVQCSPVFIPTPGVMQTPQYVHSPLTNTFWRRFKDRDWIWRIDLSSTGVSIPTACVSNLNLPTLKILDIKGNNWGRPRTIIPHLASLDKLDLTNNNLTELPPDTFQKAPMLTHVVLSQNYLSDFPWGLHRVDKIDVRYQRGEVTLRVTDEVIHTLTNVKILRLEHTRLHANVCRLLTLPSVSFLNLSACGVSHIRDDTSRYQSVLSYLDLSFNTLTALPSRIFSHLGRLWHLHLHHNSLAACPRESFRNLRFLNTLDMSHNRFTTLQPRCFSRLDKLERLVLSWNLLESLDGAAFLNLDSLKHLSLSHNRISSLGDAVHLPLQSLDLSNNAVTRLDLRNVTSLNLSHNGLVYLSEDTLRCLADVASVDLGGNRFSCCHDNAPGLMRLAGVVVNLGTRDPLTCVLDTVHRSVLVRDLTREVCETGNLALQIGIPLSVLCVVLAGFVLALHFYRFELTYLNHLFKVKRRGLEKQAESYSTCQYDAFVCYSGKNFLWVTQQLLPGLEGGPEGYRLCLHDRDFALGTAIDTNIVVSLDKSRKVIIVLTRDFISSRWCQWELEMANHRTFEQNRDYVILLELERLERRTLPRHLRYLMETRTYLEWPQHGGDKLDRAWQRLRAALGDSIKTRAEMQP